MKSTADSRKPSSAIPLTWALAAVLITVGLSGPGVALGEFLCSDQERAATADGTAAETDEDDEPKEYDLTFDDLVFKMEKTERFKREMLTPTINSYDGATIRLRGFIRPSVSQKGLTKFVFVRDNQKCCFGPGAALYDCVLVKLAEGEKTDFTVRPVTIEGKFYLKEYTGPDNRVWSIYRMKDGHIK